MSVNEDAMEDYYADCAASSLDDAERYISEGRKAKAQESYRTAAYFSAKVKPSNLPEDFQDKLLKLNRKIW